MPVGCVSACGDSRIVAHVSSDLKALVEEYARRESRTLSNVAKLALIRLLREEEFFREGEGTP